MKADVIYDGMEQGVFEGRPNRFVAEVALGGKSVRCHVKNTGRLKELLVPGRTVWVQHCEKEERKTKYSLIAVEKPGPGGEPVLVNIDSQAPNGAAAGWILRGADGLFQELTCLKREKKFGNSRFDLYFEADGRTCFMEVKGVTLDMGGVAKFPDAPTKRGVKHVEELMAAASAGYEAYILFVIQMKGIRAFAPNDSTHPAFGEALRAAKQAGVHILAYDCLVTENSLSLDRPVEVL
ncbi:MAG: DNA/RNA nuclease SfsA [Lachnospiraceae bacterium]|nr:DNA/RNA nuclease SfsA [Lachnospiraceae bacterium]